MKVEIWSDIACPWCYIGRRRFEKAFNEFDHRDQVEVIWRSFQLDPDAPREYEGSIIQMLAERKGISVQQSEQMHAHVTALAAAEGLDYRFDRVRFGNSFDAHRLLHLAAKHGLQNEMKERLQKGYFTDGLAYSDPETLIQLGVEVGLDADETRKVIESQEYTNEVNADVRRARMLGINGVPFFLFDEKYAVSGAQPAELFMTALERTWADSHPIVEVMGGAGEQDTGVCTDDSCTI
jgi:predicted DsbA family dithiol-disulfide isomerase